MLCIYEEPERTHIGDKDFAKKQLHGVSHFALKISDPIEWEKRIDIHKLDLNYGGKISWPHSSAWYVNDPTGYEIEVAFWKQGNPRFE